MSKSILIIDDEADVKDIAQMGLEMAANWNVITASSGEEGLNLALKQHPDVILLDLMMPDWDGKETLKKLKNHSLTKQIPVILMTAKTTSAIAEQIINLDIIGTIHKPFRPLQLAEQISQLLQ